jgi:hypothetical protein
MADRNVPQFNQPFSNAQTAVNLAASYATEPSPVPVDNRRSLIENPHIDYDGFLRDAAEVAELRAGRRISEATFLEMAARNGC